MRPVTIVNRHGARLAGIIHEPERAAGGVAVILLSPGVKSRVAPHRLYNAMAARLADHGLTVLRFDFHGLGDSEGSVPEKLVADLYAAVQAGRYVSDTHDAIDWLRQTRGVQQVILGGLCGGALTAVLAAATRPEVAGIVGLGLPVSLDGSRIDKTRHMSRAQLHGIGAGYRRKLLDWPSWRRFLTLQTDFALFLRSQTAVLRRRPSATAAGDLNPHLPRALFRVLDDGRPVLLIFAEADRLFAEYREKFCARHRAVLDHYEGLLEVRLVKGANHVFTFPEWQQEMLDLTMSWLPRALGAAHADRLTSAARRPARLAV